MADHNSSLPDNLSDDITAHVEHDESPVDTHDIKDEDNGSPLNQSTTQGTDTNNCDQNQGSHDQGNAGGVSLSMPSHTAHEEICDAASDATVEFFQDLSPGANQFNLFHKNVEKAEEATGLDDSVNEMVGSDTVVLANGPNAARSKVESAVNARSTMTLTKSFHDSVMALFNACGDKDTMVQSAMCQAIQNIGCKHPSAILKFALQYLIDNPKLPLNHKVAIFHVIEKVSKSSLPQLDHLLAAEIIKAASEAMTAIKEMKPEVQGAASDIMVTLGVRFCHDVMEEMIAKFQPGILPHYFVVHTMANLSSANVFEMVPFLNVILGTTLPMLSLCKHDNMRWIFSFALGKYSEAILEYVANIEEAPDKAVNLQTYSGQICPAYDYLHMNWIFSKDAKLRLAVIESIGHMVKLLPKTKVLEQLSRLLQSIFSLYKKHSSDTLSITQTLGSVLEMALLSNENCLDSSLESLLNMLFPQACVPVDYGIPKTTKNHNEVLRCLQIIGTVYDERLINFLLIRLESPQEKVKIGALSALRHLINTSGEEMNRLKSFILSGLVIVLRDPSNKVKQSIVRTIIAMAHHQYLQEEGGHKMVEFIVQQCALPSDQQKRPVDGDQISNEALRMSSQNALQLLCTTIDRMLQVVWPFLLECVMIPDYRAAIGSLCCNITNILKSIDDEGKLTLNFQALPRISNSANIFCRFLVLSSNPYEDTNQVSLILSALLHLGKILRIPVGSLWDDQIPLLISRFEAMEELDSGTRKVWEDLLLKLLNRTMEAVSTEDFFIETLSALKLQLMLHHWLPVEKNFLFRCVGVTLNKLAANSALVPQHLEEIFQKTDHANITEQSGCAMCFGFAAKNHLDLVLERLEHLGQHEVKKSSGILGFLKDSVHRPDLNSTTRATWILCYGLVCFHAPPNILPAGLIQVTKALNPFLSNPKHVKSSCAKDLCVKQSLVLTLDQIAQAMHPSHLGCHLPLSFRNQFLSFLQLCLKSEIPTQIDSDIRAQCLSAATSLIKLEPKPDSLLAFELTEVALKATIPILPLSQVIKEENYQAHVETERLVLQVTKNLEIFLNELIAQQASFDGLNAITKHLNVWSLSSHQHERLVAVKLETIVCKQYCRSMDVSLGPDSACSTLPVELIGCVIPRCTDPAVNVRVVAVDCIQTLLHICLRMQGQAVKDASVDISSRVEKRIHLSDEQSMYFTANEIGKVLVEHIPSHLLTALLLRIYDALTDPHAHSSSGAFVVLSRIFSSRGRELHQEIQNLVPLLLEKLSAISCPQTKIGALKCFPILAQTHLLPIVHILLSQPLPPSSDVLECWKNLASDPSTFSLMLDRMLDTLHLKVPFEETDGSKEAAIRTAHILPLSTVCALAEMLSLESTTAAALACFPRLFVGILGHACCMVGVSAPQVIMKDFKSVNGNSSVKKSNSSFFKTSTSKVDIDPSRCSIEALQALLSRVNVSVGLTGQSAEDMWHHLAEEENYSQGVSVLSLAILQALGLPCLTKLAPSMMSALTSPFEPRRVMAASFLSEVLVENCCGEPTLHEPIINSLLGQLGDNSLLVRKLCIRGLGNLSYGGAELVEKYSTTVLSALMTGMDDREDFQDEIILEAMSGLSRNVTLMKESHLRPILINICLRIRPAFEKNDANVRATAFSLFGHLAQFATGPSEHLFLEQLHTNFVSLLLHLNDPNTQVIKACKSTLQASSKVLKSKDLNSMFAVHLKDEGILHYGEFINDISKIIVKDMSGKVEYFIMTTKLYFRSHWPQIQQNAAMFSGFLFSSLPKDLKESACREQISAALVILLRDAEPEVRMKAAEALSLLNRL